MKYILFASMISLLSVNTYAQLGQKSASDIDCCRTGKCGNGLPQCPLQRNSLKRDTGTPGKVVKPKSAHGQGQ